MTRLFQAVFSPRASARTQRLVCFPCHGFPQRNPTNEGDHVTNGGMEPIGVEALKQLPSLRFSPSPFPCRTAGPVTTLARIGLARQVGARTFET